MGRIDKVLQLYTAQISVHACDLHSRLRGSVRQAQEVSEGKKTNGEEQMWVKRQEANLKACLDPDRFGR